MSKVNVVSVEGYQTTSLEQILLNVENEKGLMYEYMAQKNHPDELCASLFEQCLAGKFGEIPAPPGYIIKGDICVLSAEQLDVLRKKSMQRLVQSAAGHQQKLLGTDDPERQQRFAKNLEAAKALLSSNANAAQQEMLEIQLLANQQTGHGKTGDMTLRQFAAWITSYDDITTRAAGMLEALLVTYRAQIQGCSDEMQMESFLEQFDELAEEQIQELLK